MRRFRAAIGSGLGPAAGAALLLAACGAGAGGGAVPAPGTAVEIYAGRDWYLDRPEPEEDFRGVLETRPPPGGPAARALLTHVLVGGEERLPLYVVPEAAERVEPFVGREVVVRGKRVDLSAEGHGIELWAGSVRVDPG